MWCFVSEPNGTIHELILPKGSRGLDCLDMVSSRIHLIEKDYFGLRYTNPSTGVETWLNLRNKLSDQLHGKAPYRIKLLVKFYVKVQELQQPVTRDLYYSTLLNHIHNGKIDISKNKICNDIFAKLIALIAQVDYGDFNADSLPDYSTIIPSDVAWSREFQQLVETNHLKLDMMTTSEAKIEFLKLLGEFTDYGVEFFQVQSVSDKPQELTLGVRHDGLRITENSSGSNGKGTDAVRLIPYDEISTVSYKGKRFTIVHGDTDGEHVHSSFILKKNQGAIHLFRTFTEFHSFFQCNSVKKSVVEKCSNSSLRRMLSIFKSDDTQKRMFLFDVIRTRRQAYDHAWSLLNAPDKKRQSAFYHSERNFNRKSVYSVSKIDEGQDSLQNPQQKPRPLSGGVKFFITESENKTTNPEEILDNNVNTLTFEELRETVNNLMDNQTCQVCMDAKVSTAFCPCGHVVCCTDCATMCRECPLCRMQITYAQRVFFTGY
ncbi:E3 ubiquitin-protein ligase MYLIP-like [Hydractinia symbiolongicarpus]|uniref:E3 ubiquitin-protein ligase MYLIP-like n=1 Tax=Hydractinia symbiolongicarpus TaxID=13093 RepID=UPI0025501E82|nr:E3 ubiquitin-protein ligase MYLIP-like [Hydractinia symbiolongicarpus]